MATDPRSDRRARPLEIAAEDSWPPRAAETGHHDGHVFEPRPKARGMREEVWLIMVDWSGTRDNRWTSFSICIFTAIYKYNIVWWWKGTNPCRETDTTLNLELQTLNPQLESVHLEALCLNPSFGAFTWGSIWNLSLWNPSFLLLEPVLQHLHAGKHHLSSCIWDQPEFGTFNSKLDSEPWNLCNSHLEGETFVQIDIDLYTCKAACTSLPILHLPGEGC